MNKKLVPLNDWIDEAVHYIITNRKSIFLTWAWSMLVYFGTVIVFMLGAGIFSFVFSLMGITWNLLTGTLVFISGVGAFIYFLAIAGKMTYLTLKSLIAPIVSVRATWRSIDLSTGLRFYVLMILAVLAIYGGAVFLIIPMLMVGTWVSLSFNLFVDQNVGGLKALMLSRDYVRGYGWGVFLRQIVALLISGLLVLIFGLIYLFASNFGAFWTIATMILYVLATLLSVSLLYRLNYQIYLNLLAIKGKLSPTVTPMRRLGWILLICAPFIVGILLTVVIAAINPQAQINQAKKSVPTPSQLVTLP